MLNAFTLVKKARTSSFYRGLLNFALGRMIPFNKPHGFEIVDASGSVEEVFENLRDRVDRVVARNGF